MTSPGRPRAFDRQEALEKALVSFWADGYDATSMSDLTTTLGLGAPSIYAAFGDKKSLYREATELYYQRFIAHVDSVLDSASSARAAVAQILIEVADFYSADGQPRGCLVNTSAPPAGDGATEAYLRSLRNSLRDRLLLRIQRGGLEGELPASMDPVALTELYWVTIMGMAMRSRDGASRMELHQIAMTIMSTWPDGRSPDA